MDREKAKFILQSYRPDGADAGDPHCTEALKFAAEDRELGSWLADERAHDAMFAEALNSVDIPAGLKDEILSVIDNDLTIPEDLEFDSIFSGALMDVQPPSGLRDQIISAMEIEKAEAEATVEPEKVVKFPKKWFNLTAIAALLMFGAVFMFSQLPNEGDENRVALHNIQIDSGNLINASHEVEYAQDSLGKVNEWLVNEGLPEASSVPNGLISEDTHTNGGRRLKLDNGVEASMIFFEKKDTGNFYLMVLEADSVKNADKISGISQMTIKRCSTCPVTRFNVTSWKDADKVYMLLSKEDKKKITELF